MDSPPAIVMSVQEEAESLASKIDGNSNIPGIDVEPYIARCEYAKAPRVDPRTGLWDTKVRVITVCRNDKNEVYEAVTYADGSQIMGTPRGGIKEGEKLELRDVLNKPWNGELTKQQLWCKVCRLASR